MYFSVQRSVLESFKFNDRDRRAFYIKDIGQCLISQVVYTAVGYGKQNGVKTMQRLVPEKYKMRLGDAVIYMKEGDKNITFIKAVLKELGLYCFLLRCNRNVAEPFVEWVMETVLQREVWKLASSIKEKDAALALLTDDLQNNDNQIQALEFTNEKVQQKILSVNEEINHIIANKHVARRGCFENVLCFIKKNSKYFHP